MAMIKPKMFYVERYVWSYVTRYPGMTAQTIARSQAQYDDEEIAIAISRLRRRGYISGGIYLRADVRGAAGAGGGYGGLGMSEIF